MLKTKFLDVVYTHTEGQLTCFVHSGIHWPADGDILDKRRFLEERHADLRSALLDEPRGHPAMYGGFITPPSGPGFDAGIIWTDGHIYNDMCGHGTIALGMLMVAEGWTPEGQDGLSLVRLETSAGLVTIEVASSDSAALWTRFENVPAYVAEQDVSVDIPGYGTLKADIVFGGNYFAILKWDDPNLKIERAASSRSARAPRPRGQGG